MKKIFTLLFLAFFIVSCGNTEIVIEDNDTEIIEDNNFIVGGNGNNYLNIYGNILNNNLNILTSSINGKVSYLNCESGKKVYSDTVIANIVPDTSSLSYKNNLVQINSIKSQLVNLRQIKNTTIGNFDSKYRQLELQKVEIKNQLDLVNNTIGNDSEGLENQLKIIEDSVILLEKNKISSLKTIDDSIINLKKLTYNTVTKGIKRLDEIFGITSKNKNLNDNFEDYLGVKDTNLRNIVREKIRKEINILENSSVNFLDYNNEILSERLDDFSLLFKDVSSVVDNSIASIGALSQPKIDGMYKEFVGYSDGLITFKTNLDTLVNTKNSTLLTFESKQKELEQTKSQLNISKTSLNTNLNTINNNGGSLNEQYTSLKNTKIATIKEMDINILSLEQAINQLNTTFNKNTIYAGISGIIKSKNVSKNNNVGIGTPVCTIIPANNSLKLEIYSPNILEVGLKFDYYKEGELLGKGTIISESPVRNSLTQNYTYEGEVNFLDFKEGDYLDIKIITETSEDEIWIPLTFIYPKLDGYYVNLLDNDDVKSIKVEVGKMNNGKIKILSGIKKGDILK